MEDANGYEEELSKLEEALEKAVLEKEDLELALEKSQQDLEDLRLQLNAKILKQEIVAAKQEEEILRLKNGQKSIDDESSRNDELEKQLSSYKNAFETLQSWHVQQGSQLTQRLLEVDALQMSLAAADQKCVFYESEIQRQTGVVTALEDALRMDEEYISNSAEIIDSLERRNQELSANLTTYKEAWQTMTKVITEREATKTLHISDLTTRVADLTDQLNSAKAFLVPRWQLLAEKHTSGQGSAQSYSLRAQLADVESQLETFRANFLNSCVPEGLWSEENRRVGIVLSLYRCLTKSGLLLRYLHLGHFKELIEDASENEKSVENDRGFIRWLQQICKFCSEISDRLGRVAHSVFYMEKEEFTALTDVGAFLDENLPIVDSGLSRLISAAQTDHLSSAIDGKELQTFLQAFDSSPLSGVSALDECGVTHQRGVVVSVVLGLLYRLLSASVTGYCKAAYNDACAEAVDVTMWQSLWTALGHCHQALIKHVEEGSISAFSRGYGVLVPRSNANDFYRKFEMAIEGIETQLCSVHDKSVSEIRNELLPKLTYLVEVQAELEAMCVAYVPPVPRKPSTLPWNVLAAEVLDKLSNVTKLENSLADAITTGNEKQKAVVSQENEISQLKADVRTWQDKFSEARLLAERCSVVEEECQQLRTHEQEFTTILESQRREMQIAQEGELRLQRKTEDLSKQLGETKKALELTKMIPKHQHQAAWDALELANLRVIVKKLDRELYHIRLAGVEKDLEPSDLEKYVSSLAAKRLASTTSIPPTKMDEFGTAITEVADDVEDSTGEELATSSYLKKTTQWDTAVQAASLRESEELEEKEKAAIRLLGDFHALQQSIWLHSFRVPYWKREPESTDDVEAMRIYKQEHDSLLLSMASLRSRVQQSLRDRVEGSAELSGRFGNYFSVATSRYLRAYEDLAQLDKNTPKALTPVAKITVPHAPSWLSRTSSRATYQRLVVTEDQLGCLHKKLLGFN